MFDTNRQYLQSELPSDVFNMGSGSMVKGQKLIVNSNGTRSFEGGGNDLAAYDSLLKDVPKATDFAASLNVGQDNAFNEYMKYVKEQPSPLATYSTQLEQAGIPKLQSTAKSIQDQVYSLEDTLRNTEKNVNATTENSYVTEAQRANLVSNAQKPLVESLGWLGQSLGRITSAITQGKSDAITLTQLAQSGQQNIIDAFKTQIQIKGDQASRAMTGFTTDTQNFLNVSLAKISRGEKLSDQESQRAWEALQAEKAFNNQKELFNMQASQPDNQLVTANGRVMLIDSKTGKTIMDLGSSKAPETGASSGGIGSYYSLGSSGAGSSDGFQPFTSILDYNKLIK